MPDIARSFTYMFEDKSWLPKMLVGAAFVLLSGLLVGIPFVLGYAMLAIRRAYEDQESPLPEWDNFGEIITKGFMALIILVIVYVPSLILSLFGSCMWLLVVFYDILALLLVPILLSRYAITGDMNAVFQVNEIFEMLRENLASLAAVLIMQIVFGIIAIGGTLALGIGFLFSSFYATLAVSFLYGKVYQEAVKKAETANISDGEMPQG